MHFMASNNDCGVREYDMEGFQLVNHFRFPWPVNVSFLSDCRCIPGKEIYMVCNIFYSEAKSLILVLIQIKHCDFHV